MENTRISWADHTLNPWIGCQKVSLGCNNCYAEGIDKRFWGGQHWGAGATRKLASESTWAEPRKWNRQAQARGIPARVFCASLADVFDNQAPAGARERLFALIRETPWLRWLLLSKRVANIEGMLPSDWADGYANAWLGVTCENQHEAERRLPILTQIPATIRFVSAEPLLEAVDISPWLGPIGWVIVGGESGRGARHMRPAWARSLWEQCRSADVAYFFKQVGSRHDEWPGVKGKGEDLADITEPFAMRQFPRHE